MTDLSPIRVACHATVRQTGHGIAAQILDLTGWPEFRGYLVLPGIRTAEFEVRTDTIVGTRIKVTNTDGSTHVEEIIEWDPSRRLQLRMHEFSPPLSRLATHFEELWEFTPGGSGTDVVRSLALYPRSRWSRPLLWIIACLLKRALVVHLRQVAV